MLLPNNRGHLSTEQSHEMTSELDLLSTIQCVSLLADDHMQAIEAVQKASESIAKFIDVVVPKIRDGGRLIYFGCGTSGRLGVLDASECPPTFQTSSRTIIGLIAGGDASLRTSSEAKEDNPNGIEEEFDRIELSTNDVVLGIAAGGTTPWVIGGIELAKQRGVTTGFLTCCTAPSSAEYVLLLETGAEPLTGSTRLKAGTATKLTLNIITTTLFTKLGKVYGNKMVDLKASNEKLLDRAIRIVTSICGIEREDAAFLLASSDNDVKKAIVMHKQNVDCKTAKQLLSDVGGNLRAAL
jgi:N-acetylmuramic acid 6-phosphate etherase